VHELCNAQSASHMQRIYNNLQCPLFVLLSVNLLFLYFLWLDSRSGPTPVLWGSSIILGNTTIGRIPLDEISASGRYLYLSHNAHNRHPCHCGNRTRNPNIQAAVDPCLRRRGHLDCQSHL